MMNRRRAFVMLVLSLGLILGLGCKDKQRVQRERMAVLQKLARSFMDQVDTAVAGQLKTVQDWSESPELAQALKAQRSETPPAVFTQWIAGDPANRVLLLVNPEGRVVAETVQLQESDRSTRAMEAINDRRLWELKWFNRILEEKQGVVGDLSYRPFSREDELDLEVLGQDLGLPIYLIFASPVVVSGESNLSGVLILAQSWDKYYDMGLAFQAQYSKDGHETLRVVMMNQNHFVLIHPKRERVLQKRMIKSWSVQDALAGNEGAGSEFDPTLNQQVVVGYAPSKGLGEYGGIGWAALIFEQQDAILAAK